MKSFIQNFLMVICATVFALLAAEGIARLVYDDPWHTKLVAEQTGIDWGSLYNFDQNSLGLRDQIYPETKPPNSQRVIILGDSFTFGIGVANDSEVFPELLESQINAEIAPTGEIVEILNGGLPGSLTDAWLDLLLKVKDSFKPDVILMVFFLRDGTDTSSMGGFFGPIRDEIEARNTDSFYYQRSYLLRLYKDYKDKIHLSTKYSEALNEGYLGNAEQTTEWQNAKRNILKIKSIADNNGMRVGFVVFPVLVELNHNYPFMKVSEEIIRFTSENNIPTHDLLPAFIGQQGPELWVSPYDQHPNAKGHKIAADSILPFLKQILYE